MQPRHAVLCALAVLPSLGHAQLSGENLLQNLPSGYQVVSQNRNEQAEIIESIPVGQSLDDWSEMLTTQILFGAGHIVPQQFQANMIKLWADACPGSESHAIRNDQENGYAFSFWLQVCPQNKQTGKPEFTWFKAIQGQDSFYVVQKAFAFSPTKEQVTQWTTYMRSVMVCDTRSQEHPCPLLKPVP